MSPALSPNLSQLVSAAWDEATGSPAGGDVPCLAGLEVVGNGGALGSRFTCEDFAVACVATALMAATALEECRGRSPSRIEVDRDHVDFAVRSERYFRVAGQPAALGFAPLSRFWRAADGWVRTHANYPWHRSALLRALETSEDPGALAAAIAATPARDVEERVFANGGVAAMVRSDKEWEGHPQGKAVASEPLVARSVAGDTPPRPRAPLGDGALPADGIRVLDLTRVIAGPVCTRYLGALGAEVLRLDPLHRPDVAPGSFADTLVAKRSALLDVAGPDGRATLLELLDGTDVLVCGYRPGALERFGLDELSLAEFHPGLVVVCLDAWGHSGPWAERRGFDSIVQAACGIAVSESPDRETPGALPCQLLDHGTGYLAAAAVLDGLRLQAETGATHFRRLSLARTARLLVSSRTLAPMQTASRTEDPSPYMEHLGGADGPGPVEVVAPPGRLSGRALSWGAPPARYGKDRPHWEFRR